MSDAHIPFTGIVSALPSSTPFVGPEALERTRGRPFKTRLGANESAFGISPKAAAAIEREISRASWYGDPENYELREELAAKHGVAIEEICVGAGIDNLFSVIVRMTVSPGVPVVTSLGAYPTFNYQVNGNGGLLKTVPYHRDKEDPDALLDAARNEGAPLLFIANPDNPMGTWHDADTIQRMIDNVPPGKLLVLDEAYIEFAPDGTEPPLDTSNPRVIRTRTFSKAHGMAGMRIGYAIGHKDLITGLNKIRNQFEVTRLSQVAALASLSDTAHVTSVFEEVERGKREYEAIADKHGFIALPSATNFVAIDVGNGDKARAILSALGEEGVFVRMPGVPVLDRCIRVTVGTQEDRAIFSDALDKVVANLST